jgi:hypothetical protein
MQYNEHSNTAVQTFEDMSTHTHTHTHTHKKNKNK